MAINTKNTASRQINHADEMWKLHSIANVIKYADKNSKSFKTIDCIATANKIEYLLQENQFLDEQTTSTLHRVFLTHQEPEEFESFQLEQLIDFYIRCNPKAPLLKVFIKIMIGKIMEHPKTLMRFIVDYAPHFDVDTWEVAVEKMQKRGINEIGKIVESHLNRELCVGTEIKRLQEYLDEMEIECQLQIDPRQITTSLEPKQITSALRNWKLNNGHSFDKLLDFVIENTHRFNEVHWAVFAGKLHEATSTGVCLDVFKTKLFHVFDQLEHIPVIFGPGQLAQMIGGLAPFLRERPALGKKLLLNLRGNVPLMNVKELIMVLNAIRNLSKSDELIDAMIETISDDLFSNPASKDKLEKNLDLFAMLVHTCGQRGFYFNLRQIEQFILFHADQFSSRQVLEILEGLSERKLIDNARGIRSVQVIQKLVDALLREIPKISQIEERSMSIAVGTNNLASLRYLNLEWVKYALREAQNRNFLIQDKIRLILAFARLGLLNTGVATTEVKQFVNAIAKAYSDHPFVDTTRSQYHKNEVYLAYSLAILNKRGHQELSHPLIQLALSQRPESFNEADQSMLFQAMLLTDYPKKDISNLPLEFCESRLQAHVIKKLRSQIKMDARFKTAILRDEAPLLGYSNVDARIDGVKTKDNKPIIIEIDGPFHYMLNILSGESEPRELGSTEAKHRIIKNSGAHLVVIKANGLEDPNLPQAIEQGWSEITSYLVDPE